MAADLQSLSKRSGSGRRRPHISASINVIPLVDVVGKLAGTAF